MPGTRSGSTTGLVQSDAESDGRMTRVENSIASQVSATNEVRIELQSLKTLLTDVKNGFITMTAAHVELTGKVDDLSFDNIADVGAGRGGANSAMTGTVRYSTTTGPCNG